MQSLHRSRPSNFAHGRSWILRAVVSACFVLLAWVQAMPAVAVEEGETLTPLESLRGFRANEPFVVGSSIDAINASNGNVVLTVPLGQTYSVGPILSYQLTVSHNADTWEHTKITCDQTSNPHLCNQVFKPVDMAVPNPNSNAGLGWELHFGKLYAPRAPDDAFWADKQTWPNRDEDFVDTLTRWLYVSPDGASHSLHRLDGWPGVSSGARYAKDGSQIRMVPRGGDRIDVEHPNGVVSTFERTDDWAGTQVCGPGLATGCWRFREMTDPYGNFVRVDYALSGVDEVWTISDSTGREHRVVFSADPVSAGGWDALPEQLLDGDGSELGDLRRIVKRVELAAFDDQMAVYDFRYSLRRMSRGCPSNVDSDGNIGFHPDNFTIRVPVLEGIDFPEGQGFSFETHDVVTAGCHRENGRIASFVSPTQGKVAYEYGNWSFPTRCTYRRNVDAEDRIQRLGILRKEIYAVGASMPEATWDYKDFLSGAPVLSGPDCRRYDHRATRVDGPVSENRFVRTVHYTNLFEGPRVPVFPSSIDEPQVTDNGLPYRKDVQIGAGGNARFLSKETFDCEVGGDCTLEAQTYVRYEMDHRMCQRTQFELVDSSACYRVNPILAAERTQYEDDQGGHYVEKQSVRVDGAGNASLQVIRDNFEGSRSVQTSTHFTTTGRIFTADPNSGYFDFGTPSAYLPGTSEAWILHPYDSQTVEDGGVEYTRHVQFDDQGSVNCTRQLVDPEYRGAKDLVTELRRDARGLVTREIVAGGDDGQLGTSLCSTNGTAAEGTRFETVHTYDHLTRASSRIGSFPYRYRADIDRNTGLPKALYDVADQKTDVRFDRLGRIAELRPEDSLQQARTRIYYFNDPNKNPRMDVRLLAPDNTILHRVRHWFDHRGRVFQEGTWVATGGSTLQESLVRRIWDARGNLTRESTRQARDTLNFEWSTRYSAFDVFGRPRFVRRPDNTTETRAYVGVREQRSTAAVRTAETATTPVTEVTHLDGLGRVVRAINPRFALETTYDPNGNVRELARVVGTDRQRRTFGLDARGFLTFEDLPEIGAAGSPSGLVIHRRDAFGNPRTTFDGQHWLLHEYDEAGRKTATTDGQRTWQTWTYGTENAPGNFRLGKLVRAERYNYPTTEPWIVTETFRYGGGLGRTDRKIMQLTYPDATGNLVAGATFAQTFAYDRLGRRAAMSYPICAGTGFCNDPDDTPGPAHTVSYSHGFSQMTSATSSLGPSADFGYHPNAQLRVATFGNGTANAFLQGASGINRPRRIQAKRGSAVIFDTGIFRYDAVGNIAEIGDDRYTYDLAGRLLSGTVRREGAHRREDYRYDAYDNLTGVRRDGSPTWRNLHVDVKNRLAVAGLDDDLRYDNAGNLTYRGRSLVALHTPHVETSYDVLNMPILHSIRREDGTLVQEWSYLYGPGNFRALALDSATGARRWTLRDLDGKPLRALSVLGWGPYQSAGSPGEVWTFERDFIYGADGLFASVDAAGQPRYFHRDHLGSTRLITDVVGSTVYEAAFYPYGEEIALQGQGGEPTSTFTGHERDANGTTHYMLARSYGTDLGRFLSVDPVRDGWNPYTYVGGNPIGATDPTGLEKHPVGTLFHDGTAASRLNARRDRLVMAAVEDGGAAAGVEVMEAFNEGLEGPAVIATSSLAIATVSTPMALGAATAGSAVYLGQRVSGESDREAMGGTLAGIVVGAISNRSGGTDLPELGVLAFLAALLENRLDQMFSSDEPDPESTLEEQAVGVVYDEITVSAEAPQ